MSAGDTGMPECCFNVLADSAAAEALAQCAKGNYCQRCFEELARRFQVPLLHYLLRRTGSRHDAEDLLQETFLLAYRKLHRYRPDWRFSTWIFTLAHRVSLTHRRKKKLPAGDGGLDQCMVSVDPSSCVQGQELRRAIWDIASELLEPDAVSALWLSYVESMAAEEVGKVIGRSPNAVRILLHRARARLAGPLAQTDLCGSSNG